VAIENSNDKSDATDRFNGQIDELDQLMSTSEVTKVLFRAFRRDTHLSRRNRSDRDEAARFRC